MSEGEKPQRGYVRVPEECRVDLEAKAALYDVPLRSLTRVVLCLGLAMLEVDESSVKRAVARLKHADSPASPPSQVRGGKGKTVPEVAVS